MKVIWITQGAIEVPIVIIDSDLKDLVKVAESLD
jgi:hypothetical protein